MRVALDRLPGQAVDEAADLPIDQIHMISNDRLVGGRPITTLNMNQLHRVEDALRFLMNLWRSAAALCKAPRVGSAASPAVPYAVMFALLFNSFHLMPTRRPIPGPIRFAAPPVCR